MEFAIIAPVLALLVMGMVETTRGMMVKEVLDDASRAAARIGSVPGGESSNMTTCINDILTDNGLDPAKATIRIQVNGQSADPKTATQGQKISVKVSLPASSVGWVSSVFLSGKNVESQTYAMMRLR